MLIKDAEFPSPFKSGLEFSPPARGLWNIVHTGMLIPEIHEIFVCADACLRGVSLTAAEMGLSHRFSTVSVKDWDLLTGNMEDLIIDGVTDIINRLPQKPPAILVYTSCIHHFIGCDLDLVYKKLRERFDNISFAQCYMNPVMRKTWHTPDQLMRQNLYSLIKESPADKKSVTILGNDLPTAEESQLITILRDNGFTIRDITYCKTYEEYQNLGKSSLYISYYPSATMGAKALAKRLNRDYLYLPFSYDFEDINNCIVLLCTALQVRVPDFSNEKMLCEKRLKEVKDLLGDTPIAIDYSFCPKPLGLAKLLLDNGFNVDRLYIDSFNSAEEKAFIHIKSNYPNLQLFPTNGIQMRFAAKKNRSDYLAIGQKAAYFTNTNNFVNVVEGGGMWGYNAILATLDLIEDAFLHEKDLKKLIQIKAWGCSL